LLLDAVVSHDHGLQADKHKKGLKFPVLLKVSAMADRDAARTRSRVVSVFSSKVARGPVRPALSAVALISSAAEARVNAPSTG
jgi:hypothetical protein